MKGMMSEMMKMMEDNPEMMIESHAKMMER
jgi:hypothetical protein